MKSIKEIQEEFAAAPMESWPGLYEAYGQDSRKGVVNFLAKCRSRISYPWLSKHFSATFS